MHKKKMNKHAVCFVDGWLQCCGNHQNDDEEERKKSSHSQIQQLIDAAPREKDIDIYIYIQNTVSRTNYIKKQNI